MTIKTSIPQYMKNLEAERDEARRVARQWYREAQSLDIMVDKRDMWLEYAKQWSSLWKRAAKKWYALYDIAVDDQIQARDERSAAEAERDALKRRVKELKRVLANAEQTLRNLSNAELIGDGAEIARNEAQNLRDALSND